LRFLGRRRFLGAAALATAAVRPGALRRAAPGARELTGSSVPRFAAGASLREARGGRFVLVHPRIGEIEVNEGAVAALVLANGVRSVDEIAAQLARERDVEADVCAADVLQLFHHLAVRGMIATCASSSRA
jgi:hypothetical protein